MRTSTGIRRLVPSGSIMLSWSTRSSFAWSRTSMSPISSRKSVPSSAAWNLPTRSACAPLKAPRTCPKSSLSRRSAGIAVQLSGTNSFSFRGESS